VLVLLVVEGERVNRLVADVHHPVAKVRVGTRRDLEGFVATCGCEKERKAKSVRYVQVKESKRRRTGDDGVGGSDGGNDALDDTLRERPSHAVNLVLVRSMLSRVVKPLDVLGVVVIKFFVCEGGTRMSPRNGRNDRNENAPLKTRGHSRMLAHSMQCSGRRGVLAIVQMGKAVGGVRVSILHS
jgi:hypothetical protein